MILYNGASGGLGRYVGPALRGRGAVALRARLEDREGLRRELAQLPSLGGGVVLLQLAARVSVPACEADPEGTHLTNVVHVHDTVLDVVEWAGSRGLHPRVVYVSSGHVYAASPAGVRVAESSTTAPRSAYARSKLRAEEELRALASRRPFDLMVARVFGLIAPQQPANYVLPGLIRRVRERDLRGVPGLSYVRDYLDARDVCEDLLELGAVEDGAAWGGSVVNLCSGEGVALAEILRTIARVLRPGQEDELLSEVVEAPGRPDDVPWIVGDPSRFVALTRRQPRRISLEQTVRDAVRTG